ncbi:MAG: uracil-DNA glycosylase [Robiginitomaculum sp.]|nr:MAG: uracil-DNA glycosylase [Robiginitomaculum sp.]
MSDPIKTPDDISTAHHALNAWWEAAGVEVAPLPKARTTSVKLQSPHASPPRATTSPPNMPAAPEPELARKAAAGAGAETLDALKTALENFDAGPVKAGARNTVFARGNPQASIMIIGEAPGRDEDEQGLPFVGASGQLLDRMLRAAGFGEDDVYITNAFNWRPPKNRKPTPDELAMTLPFLERHIALIAPKIILLVGASPMQAVLGVREGITRARGQWHDYTVKNADGTNSDKTIPALPTFHPAFLLRAPLAKRDVWHDLQSIQERLAAMG